MQSIRCRGVNIRFNKQNFQQQRIRSTDITTADYLVVVTNALWVTVYYCRDEDGKVRVVKSLSFNRNDVIETECEDLLNCTLVVE